MEKDYSLTRNFKRLLIIDAVDSSHEGNSLQEWAEIYTIYQGPFFPGEKACVDRLATYLESQNLGFDPRKSSNLVDKLLDDFEGAA